MSNERQTGPAIFDSYYSGGTPEGGSKDEDASDYSRLEASSFGTRSHSYAGSAKIDEANAQSISSSGSLAVLGSAKAASFRNSGSATVDKDLIALDCKCSGSLHVHGRLVAGELSTSGSLMADGGVRARDTIRVSGLLRAPWVRSRGRVDISGRIETGALVCKGLTVSGGGRAGDVQAEAVEINTESHRSFGRHFHLFKDRDSHPFKAVSISALSSVAIDLCDVGKIKGGKVWIGRNSHVREVEYTESCEVEDGASIDRAPVRVSPKPG